MTKTGSKWRRVDNPLASLMPGMRSWQKDVIDGHLSVIVGREPSPDGPIWHMSISHRTNEVRPQPGRYPVWDEIVEARYRFVPDAVTMAMILPPREQYVNVMDTCFHLYEIPGEVA